MQGKTLENFSSVFKFSKARGLLISFTNQEPSYTRNHRRKDMQATLSICLLIFSVCLQGDFCGSNQMCNENQYTVKSADGNFEKCQPCGVCNEGWGLEPKCGGIVISPVKDTYCQRCHKGTYSDTYDSSPCYVCQLCAKHEIVSASCTSDANTKCNGTCEHGYYYNTKDGSHACHECSYCCSDGKHEIQAECVRHGLDKRQCSLRIDKDCGPAIKASISSTTGESGQFMANYILYIIIGVLFGVIISIIVVVLWRKRRNNGQINLSGDTNTITDQQVNQYGTQPMIHVNGGADPQYGDGNLTTSTQSGNNNQLAQSVSSGVALHLDSSRLNPGYAPSNTGTPHVSPGATPDLSMRQQDGSGQIIIVQHPTSQRQTEGLCVEFSCKCEVQSGTQVSYQWYKDDQELVGKTLDTLVLKPVRMQDFGCYRCLVTRLGDVRVEVKSNPADLNVTPPQGKKLKALRELKFDTQNQVAILLENTFPGVGGWRQIAYRNGMDDVSGKNLETKQDPGKLVMEFLQASNPELTVHSFCKMLKEIKRFDIVKVVEDELISD